MRRLAAFAALLVLAGCASTPVTPPPAPPVAAPVAPAPPPPVPRPDPAPAPLPPPAVGVSLDALPGWTAEDHAAALRAYQRTCRLNAAQRAICEEAQAFAGATAQTARAFFEARFAAVPVSGGPDLLTAYFAPEYQARRRPDAEFSAPVRPRPSDLPREPGPTAYPDRAAIDRRPTRDAIAWMRPEDLFFLQIQGSGSLTFEDGQVRRAAFAGHNGRTFVGIAGPMVRRGLLPEHGASASAIREWLSANRGERADAMMRLNPRYVFFVLEGDDGGEPRGAAGVPLPAGRSIAVDPAHHRYGEVMWLDAQAPSLSGAFPAYRRMVMALDTGGAIRGAVRADLYMGRGDAAGAEAGRVRHQLRMWRLIPRT